MDIFERMTNRVSWYIKQTTWRYLNELIIVFIVILSRQHEDP